jgi:tetratricopeptide (TPR) repeat protein
MKLPDNQKLDTPNENNVQLLLEEGKRTAWAAEYLRFVPGQLDGGRCLNQRAIGILMKAESKFRETSWHFFEVDAIVWEGSCYEEYDQYDLAIQCYHRCAEILRQNSWNDTKDLPWRVYDGLARCMIMKEPPDTDGAWRNVLVAEKYAEHRVERLLSVENLKAITLERLDESSASGKLQGEHERVVRLREDSVRIALEKNAQPDQLAEARWHLAVCYNRLGRYADALKTAQAGLDESVDAHPNVATHVRQAFEGDRAHLFECRGDAEFHSGKIAAAKQDYQMANQIWAQVPIDRGADLDALARKIDNCTHH